MKLRRAYPVGTEVIATTTELEIAIARARNEIYVCPANERHGIEDKLKHLNNIKKVEAIAIGVAKELAKQSAPGNPARTTKPVKPLLTAQRKPIQVKIYIREGKHRGFDIRTTYESMQELRENLKHAINPYCGHKIPRMFNALLKDAKSAPDATPYWQQLNAGATGMEYRLEPEYAREIPWKDNPYRKDF